MVLVLLHYLINVPELEAVGAEMRAEMNVAPPGHRYHIMPPLNAFKVKDFALSETLTTVTATGGSALIQAGNNMVLSAGHLENQASNIVAKK